MLLEVEGINAYYGDSHILHGLSFSVGEGEIVCLLGRNGVGKTTTLLTIMGYLVPRPGHIAFAGRPLERLPAYLRARLGIGFVPQERGIFPSLTVRENLELGSYATKDYNWDPVTGYFPKLKLLMGRKAGHLSGGERQMLMIGRAMLGSPKVLLIDEPTEGLAPSIVSHLKHVFQELSKNTALVIVEQNLPLVCALSHKVYAMKEGRIVAELADRDSIRTDVCERYL